MRCVTPGHLSWFELGVHMLQFVYLLSTTSESVAQYLLNEIFPSHAFTFVAGSTTWQASV